MIISYREIDINILPIDINILPLYTFLQDSTDLKSIIDKTQIINRACCNKNQNVRDAANTLIRKENRSNLLLLQNRNIEKKINNSFSPSISCSSSLLSSRSHVSNSININKKFNHKNRDNNSNMFFSHEIPLSNQVPSCRSGTVLLLIFYQLYCSFSIYNIVCFLSIILFVFYLQYFLFFIYNTVCFLLISIFISFPFYYNYNLLSILPFLFN